MTKNLTEAILRAEEAVKDIKDLSEIGYVPIKTLEEFKEITTTVISDASKKSRITRGSQEPKLSEAFKMQELGIPIESWKDTIKYQKVLAKESVKRKLSEE